MKTYISILRGINVTGHHTVRMADLKALYEELGFTGVETYIQSGNVVFKGRGNNPSTVAARIVGAIANKYGFSISVVIRLPNELASVIRKNPFAGRRGVDETRLHVTFLEEKPAPGLVKGLGPLTATSNDEFEVIGREVYLHCPDGYGKTLLSNTFFEKNLKVSATTRNWNTVRALNAMVSQTD